MRRAICHLIIQHLQLSYDDTVSLSYVCSDATRSITLSLDGACGHVLRSWRPLPATIYSASSCLYFGFQFSQPKAFSSFMHELCDLLSISAFGLLSYNPGLRNWGKRRHIT